MNTLFVSKTYPIKGAPVYRAYCVGETVIKVASDTSIRDLVATLEAASPKPAIYFDDAARLDFFHSLDDLGQ